jgi:hypothetical protein
MPIECSLQGIIEETSKNLIRERLKAFCQIIEKPFSFKEISFKYNPNPGL